MITILISQNNNNSNNVLYSYIRLSIVNHEQWCPLVDIVSYTH